MKILEQNLQGLSKHFLLGTVKREAEKNKTIVINNIKVLRQLEFEFLLIKPLASVL